MRFKNLEKVKSIQKFVVFYLCAVMANVLAEKYVCFDLWGRSVNLSYGAILLGGLCVAFVFMRKICGSNSLANSELMSSWQMVWGVMAVHMIFVFGVLRWFYGYGYEHDLRILGQIGGYFVLFICMRCGLEKYFVRVVLAIAMGIGFRVLAGWGRVL